jgi:Tfp pilus assembly protein PilE
MNIAVLRRRGGFTLVELLVVIAIIEGDVSCCLAIGWWRTALSRR